VLRKEDSNRILKHVKLVSFAVGLSLLNPINVEAQEVKQETLEEDGMNLYIVCATTSTLIGVFLGGFFGIKSKKAEEKNDNFDICYSVSEDNDCIRYNSNELIKKLVSKELKHERI